MGRKKNYKTCVVCLTEITDKSLAGNYCKTCSDMARYITNRTCGLMGIRDRKIIALTKRVEELEEKLNERI